MSIHHTPQASNLLEVLEKILDKGVVIAGDIKISLADVDLLTIKIRLLIASVDKAREIGMDWWETDSYYSSKARLAEKENVLLHERINRLEQLVEGKALPLQTEDKELLEPVEENTSQPQVEERVQLQQLEQKELAQEVREEESPQDIIQERHDYKALNTSKKHEKKKHPGKH